MKKATIAAIATAAALIGSGTIYPNTMVITETNYETDTVTMSTCSGVTYQFEGVEDYYVGDLVSVIMFDNGTPEVYDDIILSHRYAGVTEFFDELATPEY